MIDLDPCIAFAIYKLYLAEISLVTGLFILVVFNVNQVYMNMIRCWMLDILTCIMSSLSTGTVVVLLLFMITLPEFVAGHTIK